MTTCIKAKQENTHYIDCAHCSMQPVCLPLKADKTQISIMDSYLSKRNIVTISKPLFIENQDADAIYAICAGSFKLTETSPQGHEKVIGFRFPGELIGEDAIHTQNYNYNAVAIGNTTVCRVDLAELNVNSVDISLNCSSFDEFQNFENRGEVFTQLVKGLNKELS